MNILREKQFNSNQQQQDRGYNPQQEIFQRKNINEYKQDQLFPPKSINDLHQFKVSQNTSFKFFSEQKAKRDAVQAEIEKQQRFCYSDQTPRINVFDENNNNIKFSHLKHQEKLQKQLNSSQNSQSKNLLVDTSYQKINYPDRNTSVNTSMSSDNGSNLNFGRGQPKGILKDTSKFQNILEERSSNNSSSNSNNSIRRSYDDYSSQDENTFDLINKSDASYERAIKRKTWGIAKNIMFIAFVLIAFTFICLSLYKIYHYYNDRAIQNHKLIEEILKKNEIFASLTKDSSKSHNVDLDLEFHESKSQKIMNLARFYYNKFLLQIQVIFLTININRFKTFFQIKLKA